MNAKIQAIATYVPSDRIVISHWVDSLDIPRDAKAGLHKLFKFTQAKTKPWPKAHETPVFMIEDAFQHALERSGLHASDIDLLIYSGVQKGVVEPSQAHLTACSLGLARAHCFDVSEACIGWVRALEIAELFVRGAKAKNVVIASAISSQSPGGALRRLNRAEELEDLFASFTVGTAASVTIVSGTEGPGMNLQLTRRSNTGTTDDCALPTHDYPIYTKTPMKDWRPGVFQAFGRRLFSVSKELVTAVAKEGLSKSGGMGGFGKILITHSMSKTFYDEILDEIPFLRSKHYNTYPWSGNITDNTVPVAILQAISEGILGRSDRVSALINGSGSSSVLASFNLGI